MRPFSRAVRDAWKKVGLDRPRSMKESWARAKIVLREQILFGRFYLDSIMLEVRPELELTEDLNTNILLFAEALVGDMDRAEGWVEQMEEFHLGASACELANLLVMYGRLDYSAEYRYPAIWRMYLRHRLKKMGIGAAAVGLGGAAYGAFKAKREKKS